jgi:thiol-disulfide isomerase/thioredoxin
MTRERWQGIKEIIKVYGLGLLVVILVSVAWDFLQPKPKLPEFAPDFTLVDVRGEEHQLSQYLGKTVVLNFWASWCRPCVSEIPDFARYASEHPEVVLLGLATERSESDAVSTAERLGAEYPIIMAGSVSDEYDVSVLPTTIVVSPDGRIKQVSVGAMSYRALSAAVER